MQILIGTIGLSFGATYFVEGAKGIATYLGVSDFKDLTLNFSGSFLIIFTVVDPTDPVAPKIDIESLFMTPILRLT